MRTVVTLNPGHVHAIASMGSHAADRTQRTHSPVLGVIRTEFSRATTAHQWTVDVYSTDRCRVAHMRFDLPAAAVEIEDEALAFNLQGDVDFWTAAAKLIGKTYAAARDVALISENAPAGMLTLEPFDGQAITALENPGNFPPVARLFPDEITDIPAGMMLRPKFLGDLAKITAPSDYGRKRFKRADSPWEFSRADSSAYGHNVFKASVLATMTDAPECSVRVLIQPNLKLR